MEEAAQHPVPEVVAAPPDEMGPNISKEMYEARRSEGIRAVFRLAGLLLLRASGTESSQEAAIALNASLAQATEFIPRSAWMAPCTCLSGLFLYFRSLSWGCGDERSCFGRGFFWGLLFDARPSSKGGRSLPTLLRSYGMEAPEDATINDQDAVIALVQDLFACISAGEGIWFYARFACVDSFGFSPKFTLVCYGLSWISQLH
jgi:hypothetical protein